MAGIRILLVEDEPQFLSLIALMLRGRGYQYLGAQSGAKAIRIADHEVPDLIILDIMMPGMDGLEVCRRLRANPRTADIPILVVTAKAQPEDRIEALEAGADDYLSKPVDPVQLRARVEGLLAAPARVQTEAEPAPPVPVERVPGTRVIGFLGCKGGVGTSTVAANVAVALARDVAQDREIALMALHSDSASLALQLGLRPERGVETLAPKSADDLNVSTIQAHMTRHESGVMVLSGLLNPARSLPSLDGEQADAIVRNLGAEVDYELVDMGTGLGAVNQALLPQLNYLVVVVEPQRVALLQAQSLLARLDDVGMSAQRMGLALVNKTPMAVSLNKEAVAIFLQREVVCVAFAAPELVYHAAEQGVPIMMLRPEALVCNQLRELAGFLASL